MYLADDVPPTALVDSLGRRGAVEKLTLTVFSKHFNIYTPRPVGCDMIFYLDLDDGLQAAEAKGQVPGGEARQNRDERKVVPTACWDFYKMLNGAVS